MALLLAPYNNAMRIGQGFNSYTQQICVDDAVLVDPDRAENVVTNDLIGVDTDGTTMRILVQSMGKPSAWSRQREIVHENVKVVESSTSKSKDGTAMTITSNSECSDDTPVAEEQKMLEAPKQRPQQKPDSAPFPEGKDAPEDTTKLLEEKDAEPQSNAIGEHQESKEAPETDDLTEAEDKTPETASAPSGTSEPPAKTPEITNDTTAATNEPTTIELTQAELYAQTGSADAYQTAVETGDATKPRSSSSKVQTATRARSSSAGGPAPVTSSGKELTLTKPRKASQYGPLVTRNPGSALTPAEVEAEAREREEERKEERERLKEHREYQKQLQREAREEEKQRRAEKRQEEKARREEQRKNVEWAVQTEKYSKEEVQKMLASNQFVERFSGMLENEQDYIFDPTAARGPSQTVTYTSRFVDRLSDVTDNMAISGSLSIKAGKIGGSGSGAFIDSDKFKSSDLNYYLNVKVINQTINFKDALVFNPLRSVDANIFREVYGDSFISGFLEGGEFNAIVSIKILNKAKKTDIAASAKVAFTTGPMDIKAEAEVNMARANIETNTETTIQVNWSGGGHIKPMEQQWDIKSLMQAAARFPDLVAECPQRIYAILTKYDTLRSFVRLKPASYTPLQYENAQLYTNSLMEAYMTYKAMHKQIGADIFAIQNKTKLVVPWPKDKVTSKEVLGDKAPFTANLAGLEECRKHILRQMARIVNEVDLIEKDPKVATDEDHVEPFQSPLVFETRVPVIEWTEEANPDNKAPLDGSVAVVLTEAQKKAKAAQAEMAKRARQLFADETQFNEEEKQSLVALHGNRQFIGEHLQVTKPVGSETKGTFFNNIDFLQSDWLVTSVRVQIAEGALGAVIVHYANGLILTRGKAHEREPFIELTNFARGERVTSAAIETGNRPNSGAGDTRVVALYLYTNRGRHLEGVASQNRPKGQTSAMRDQVEYENLATIYFDAPFEKGTVKGFIGRSDDTHGAVWRLGIVWGDLEKDQPRAQEDDSESAAFGVSRSGVWNSKHIPGELSKGETVKFDIPFENIPRLLHGLCLVDLISDPHWARGRTNVANVQKTGFEINVAGDQKGDVFSVRSSWLTLPDNEVNFHHGTCDTRVMTDNAGNLSSFYIQFPQAYKSRPQAIAWFTGFDLGPPNTEKQQDKWKVRTYVKNVTPTGLVVVVETWDWAQFRSAQVGWCAWDAEFDDKKVRSGQRDWKQGGSGVLSIPWPENAWSSAGAPSFFTAISSFSARSNATLRLQAEMKSNSTQRTEVDFKPASFPSLRTVIGGGELMSQSEIDTWGPHVRLLNVYGPAECCVLSTVQNQITLESDPRDIGWTTGCVGWVVGPSDVDRLMPIGSVGELLIQGHTVGRGYLGDVMVDGGAQLVAFLKPAGSDHGSHALFLPPTPDFHDSVTQATASLRRTVPRYIIAAIFLPISLILRTASDKVDRRRLRETAGSLSRISCRATGNCVPGSKPPLNQSSRSSHGWTQQRGYRGNKHQHQKITLLMLSTKRGLAFNKSHTTTGCGKQGFPSAQPYLSHTPGGKVAEARQKGYLIRIGQDDEESEQLSNLEILTHESLLHIITFMATAIAVLTTLGTWIAVFRHEFEDLLRYILRQLTSDGSLPTATERSVATLETLVELKQDQLRATKALLLLQRQHNENMKAKLEKIIQLIEDIRELKFGQLPTRT
ncbi:hypothetical protein BO97DRAFT_480426 [Aspergillus homomorphus CBS 101889]|uniref:Uncharacterized protein n=1 Tax=Aspergillus homomorphus (strain CBS 101889) TaxID=1450537 RepID=A0A395HPI2_ASPHC|nr:hypothetical protein BO97DRAFT_480426 [Aspergillus homomorphus CBS 101889]RAL08768.1 hypothetical protein BO97DRAFT_480426 [Aspergillus homomorphus CBS 101889]